jgi:ABC-type Mn2+/Zn2+ transport system permease subunit
MISYGHGLVGYILTIISLIHALIGFIVSTIVVIAIIYYQYHHRLKREAKITLVLSANIYSFLVIYTIILIATNIQTLLGDIYGINYDSSWCIFREYFITVIVCALYYTFVVQVNRN